MLRQVPKPSCSYLIDTAMIVIDATSARFPVKETQDVSVLSSLRQGVRMHFWPPLSEKSSVRLGDTTRSTLISIQYTDLNYRELLNLKWQRQSTIFFRPTPPKTLAQAPYPTFQLIN